MKILEQMGTLNMQLPLLSLQLKGCFTHTLDFDILFSTTGYSDLF